MTLQEWQDKTKTEIGFKPNKWVYVPDVGNLPSRSELWNLTDYRVTSVTGGVIWLLPK